MKKFLFLIGSGLIFLFGCLKKDESGFYIFKIKKGDHRSTTRYQRVSTNSLNFTIILTESCKYQSNSPDNQLDINKVFGMSDGGNHMNNSARIGWRYYNNKLELHAYTHYNGNFDFKKICDVDADKEYNCQISYMDGYYNFVVNSVSVTMPRFENSDKKKYLLYPYFGGDETAPQDITIKVKF